MRPGQDLRYDLEIEFEEAVHGLETQIRVPRLDPCESCGGDLTFHIGVQSLRCPFCGAVKEMTADPESAVREQDLQAMLSRLAELRGKRFDLKLTVGGKVPASRAMSTARRGTPSSSTASTRRRASVILIRSSGDSFSRPVSAART